MKKLIGALAICAVLSLALYGPARNILELSERAKEPAYSSEKPVYLKLALNEDGSKTMSVVFDESKGTGKGYDVLYADVDLNGRFDQGEKVSAKSHNCSSGVHCDFPAIKVKAAYSGKAAGTSNPCEVTLNYSKHWTRRRTAARILSLLSAPATTTTARESFLISSNVKLDEGATRWEYSLRGSVKPSETSRSAPVWSVLRTPELKLTAKPDEQKKGNLGVGIELLSGESNLAGKKAGAPLKAKVEIKKPDGSVVHQADDNLDKFGLG